MSPGNSSASRGRSASTPSSGGNGRDEKEGSPVVYGNSTGDSFTFDVYRCARGEVGFRADRAAAARRTAGAKPAQPPHTLEIVAAGDGAVCIEGLYVFQPPEKE